LLFPAQQKNILRSSPGERLIYMAISNAHTFCHLSV